MEKQHNYVRDYYDEKDSGRVYLFAMIIPQLLMVVVAIGLMIAKQTEENIYTTIFSYVISQACYFTIYSIYNLKTKTNYKTASKLFVKFPWWFCLIAVGLGLVCLFGFNNFIGLIDWGLDAIGYKSSGYALPLSNGWWLTLSILLVAVLPAICEELIFRGVLFNGLKKIGTEKAVFFTAFLFSLFHTSPSQTIYQFILGIILAYLVVFSKSIIPSMILHFTNNFTILIIYYLQLKSGTAIEEVVRYAPVEIVLAVVYAVVAALVLFLFIFLFRKLMKQKEIKTIYENDFEPEPKTKMSSVFNKYMVAGIVFGVIMWILDLTMQMG